MNNIIKFLPTIDAPESTKLPQRSTKFSAGYDFYAPTDIFVPAGGESVLVPLNVKAIMPGDMVQDCCSSAAVLPLNSICRWLTA